MDCEKIQEIIITDYIDARMEGKAKSLIDQHLAHCTGCKDFLINIKKETVDPFINAREAFPDQFLWSRIKQTIEEEQEKQVENSFIPNFWERLRHAFYVPRPAFALATIVSMIIMVGTTGQFFMNSMFVRINGGDQMEYLSTLIDEPLDLASNNGNDAQTPIEKYFL